VQKPRRVSDAEFAKSTRDFRALYDRINDSMSDFRATLTTGEADWFGSLVEGFQARFEMWQTDASLRGYLKHLDRLAANSRHGPQLRLVGHVYLHIALDLPRVIGESLENSAIPRDRAADIFRQPNWAFREAFIDTILNVEYVGWTLAYLLRFVSRSRKLSSALRLPADRILVWRLGAWINGHALAEPRTRPNGESVLRRTFDDQCRVMRESSDPIVWLEKLDSPWTAPEAYNIPIATRFGPAARTRGPDARPDDFLD
jgi:uncharacterized protein YukE